MTADPASAAVQAGISALAADALFQARVKEFEAQALAGTVLDLERARDFAIGAAEALLDAKYTQAINVIRSWGIDPAERVRQ